MKKLALNRETLQTIDQSEMIVGALPPNPTKPFTDRSCVRAHCSAAGLCTWGPVCGSVAGGCYSYLNVCPITVEP